MVLDTVEMAPPLKSLIGACVPSTGQMQKCAKRCRELSIVTLVRGGDGPCRSGPGIVLLVSGTRHKHLHASHLVPGVSLINHF